VRERAQAEHEGTMLLLSKQELGRRTGRRGGTSGGKGSMAHWQDGGRVVTEGVPLFTNARLGALRLRCRTPSSVIVGREVRSGPRSWRARVIQSSPSLPLFPMVSLALALEVG